MIIIDIMIFNKITIINNNHDQFMKPLSPRDLARLTREENTSKKDFLCEQEETDADDAEVHC